MQGHLGSGADALDIIDRPFGCPMAEVLEMTFHARKTVYFWVPDSGAAG